MPTPAIRKAKRPAPSSATAENIENDVSLNREKRRSIVSAEGWKKSGSTTVDTELELPSGNFVLARRPGLMNLLKENVLPDVLSMMAQQQVDAAKGKAGAKEQEFDFARIMEEQGPEGLATFFEAFDRIAAHSVVQPELRFHKREVEYDDGTTEWEFIPEDERDSSVAYTDEVDENDRIFIGQWAMSGQTDLASFRS